MITMMRHAIDTLSRRSRDRAICQGERPTIFLGAPGKSGGVSEREALSRRASASNFPAIKAIPENLSFGLFDLPTRAPGCRPVSLGEIVRLEHDGHAGGSRAPSVAES